MLSVKFEKDGDSGDEACIAWSPVPVLSTLLQSEVKSHLMNNTQLYNYNMKHLLLHRSSLELANVLTLSIQS